MTKSKKTEEKKMGRTKTAIDWTLIGDLVKKGNSGADAAQSIGIDRNTLYKRCVTDNGISFDQFLRQKRAKGICDIKSLQFDLAMAGDKAMLIWLGKNICGQTDGPEKQVTNFYFKEIDPTNATDRNSVQVSVPSISSGSMESSEEW